jgi:phosphoribosylformimino-5-aminoimidazole carboxamide ribonucleotide (ProFAR) isomerase
VSSLGDLQRLSQYPRIHGAIIGKALYDNAIRLHDAVSNRNRMM